jgi:hypothetical protein
MRITALPTTRGSAAVFAFALSLFALAGCVAYEPYPATPVYGSPYYAPAPGYYYQPCCTSYYSFSYSNRDRGYYGRGFRHHHRGWR